VKESEWLASEDPAAMLSAHPPKERQMRMFAWNLHGHACRLRRVPADSRPRG